MKLQQFSAFFLGNEQQQQVFGGAKPVSVPNVTLPATASATLPVITLPVIDHSVPGAPVITPPVITHP
ncbi:hypothetical protein C7N43_15760 [Sphingobacteriales bacterium UPWRP_1]|nr:hypothetical protein BVG80_04405 [Sphingobacteriales bacterium TSM_CSM]PSJ76064.1 hypothetical protein C7N43_15760 [Sphingobacteriales bacterium UPWRP_1]